MHGQPMGFQLTSYSQVTPKISTQGKFIWMLYLHWKEKKGNPMKKEEKDQKHKE